MSTNKAKNKAKARKGRRTPNDLGPRKSKTQGITGGSNANFPPGYLGMVR